MTQYIWQHPNWPNFTWDYNRLALYLGKARQNQGRLLGKAGLLGLEVHADFLTEEAIQTSAIEGETLDRNMVRSSVAKRLGLPTAGLPSSQRAIDGLVDILLNATTDCDQTLTADRLFGWHAALFPTGYSSIHKITVAAWRADEEGPMQVVSGPVGKEIVHYEAPAAEILEQEITQFLDWWHNPPADLDGIVRAAIAHLWFISLHPFDDGNGRIARALTDMALAQDEGFYSRLYSISAQIILEHERYYSVLERTQKGDLDITNWIAFFLQLFTNALETSETLIAKTLVIAKFWQQFGQEALNARQLKVINRLLVAGPSGFEGGLTKRKYVSMTKASAATATRDLTDLVQRHILLVSEKGRNVRYTLSIYESSSTQNTLHT